MGLGFRAQGLGVWLSLDLGARRPFRVWYGSLRASASSAGGKGLKFEVWGSGFGVWGLEFGVCCRFGVWRLALAFGYSQGEFFPLVQWCNPFNVARPDMNNYATLGVMLY